MKKESIIISVLIGLFVLSIVISLGRLPEANRAKRVNSISPMSPFRPDDGIALLHITGIISATGPSNLFSEDGLEGFIKQLKLFEEDRRVKALIIRINSPGGTVGASQELFYALQKFKEKKDIPIVASIADIGASGGYWVSLAADTIYANPGSLVGSIGVIISNYDLSDVQKKYGIGMNTLKSGKYKDILSSWRQISPDEKVLLNTMLENIHNQFIGVVKNRRPMIKEKELSALTDGRIFTGLQAQEKGLIDHVGGLQQAISFAAKEAGISEDHIIRPKRPIFDWKSLVGSYRSQLFSSLLHPAVY